MIRSADDFDVIRARWGEIRAEEIRAQAEAAAQREKEGQALVPVPVAATPAVAPEHVVVGWEEPADPGVELRPIGEFIADGLSRKVNPALEGVFARLRGYLDDCDAGVVVNGEYGKGVPLLPARRLGMSDFFLELEKERFQREYGVTATPLLPPSPNLGRIRDVKVIEGSPERPTFRGVPLLPAPPNLGKLR